MPQFNPPWNWIKKDPPWPGGPLRDGRCKFVSDPKEPASIWNLPANMAKIGLSIREGLGILRQESPDPQRQRPNRVLHYEGTGLKEARTGPQGVGNSPVCGREDRQDVHRERDIVFTPGIG